MVIAPNTVAITDQVATTPSCRSIAGANSAAHPRPNKNCHANTVCGDRGSKTVQITMVTDNANAVATSALGMAKLKSNIT